MRQDRVLTRLLSAASASVLLVALTACGGDEDPAAEETPDATTSEVTSAEPDEEMESESADPAEGVAGGYDADELLENMKAAIAENESAHVMMELTGGGQQMSGEGDVSYAGDTTSMQMEMQMPQLGSGTMQMRMVDGVIYMSMPPMTPEGKWFEIDTNDPDSPLGDLGGVTGGDPLATFDAFDAGLEEVTYLGEEDVDGESLHHYVLTVDAEKAAKAQGQPVQPGMPETITYDMWIDDDDLMRRIEFDFGDLGGSAGAGGGSMVMTMTDWGKPVTVEAPRRADILRMPSGMPTQ